MNLICGINPVLEALGAATRHFDRLLVVKGLRNKRISDAISRAGSLGIPLRFEARETLDRMAGGIPHQGLIAVVSAKPVITVEKLLEEARTPALVVVLDGVEDPRNLGAILRTVEACGADGVLLPDRHSAGLSETVARSSAGGLEHVRVASIGNVVQTLEALKAKGLWVVGFDASGTERWDAVDYRRPIALVLGGEGRGIRRLVREHCDHLVSIPLFGHVGSLNVSVAAGIALYEIVRQRGATPSHVRPIPIKSAGGPRIVGPGAEDGEHDPGLVARYAQADDPEEADESRAEPVGLGEDEDRPAWSGPTVLKAVMGPARDQGVRSTQGRGHRRHGPGRSGGGGGFGRHRGESTGGTTGGDSAGGSRGEARGSTPPPAGAGPAGPRGPRRRRRGRGNGPRPAPGGAPSSGESRDEAPPRDRARDPHVPHGDAGTAAPGDASARDRGSREDRPEGPVSAPDGRPRGPEGEGSGDPKRRRRRRRRR
jgi:23S rRNA (guanosine2251-2'-O)-methyltransferase